MAEEKRFKELAHRDVIDWQRGTQKVLRRQVRNVNTNTGNKQETPGDRLQGRRSVILAMHFETFLVNTKRWAARSISVEEAPNHPPNFRNGSAVHKGLKTMEIPNMAAKTNTRSSATVLRGATPPAA